MAEPRFQVRVVRRRSSSDSGVTAAPASDLRPTGLDDVLVWRLLGSNNRELARSGEQFDAEADCRAAIDHLRSLVSDRPSLVPAYWSVGELGTVWWWGVRDAARLLATAARPFSRQLQCRSNYDQFLRAVPPASVVQGALRAPRISSSRRPGHHLTTRGMA